MLLRALGWSSDEDILHLFGLIQDVDVKTADLAAYVGKLIAADVIDMNTGEIFLSKDSTFLEEHIERLKTGGIKKIRFMDLEDTGGAVILNTIIKDTSRSTDDAFEAIYRVMRSSEAPDMEAARGLLEKLFFNQKRLRSRLGRAYSASIKPSTREPRVFRTRSRRSRRKILSRS